jgi:hypothetical protein
MSSRTLIAFLLVLLIGGSDSPCWAKKKKKSDASTGTTATIIEVNFASITLDNGTQDQAPQTFKVTNDTKVTLNGVPATTEDLLAGMQTTITPSADNTVALVIAAENPKAIPNKY